MVEQQAPRALVLQAEDRAVLIARLARAVLRFQDEFLSAEASPAGLLVQVRRGGGGGPAQARDVHGGAP